MKILVLIFIFFSVENFQFVSRDIFKSFYLRDINKLNMKLKTHNFNIDYTYIFTYNSENEPIYSDLLTDLLNEHKYLTEKGIYFIEKIPFLKSIDIIKENITSFFVEVMVNHTLNLIEYLSNNNFDFSKKNNGYTYLFELLEYSTLTKFKYMSKIADLLIKKGVDVNFKDSYNENLLFIHCSEFDINLLNVFVKNGININEMNKRGLTPLDCLYKFKGTNSKENIEYLRSKGAKRWFEIFDIEEYKNKYPKKIFNYIKIAEKTAKENNINIENTMPVVLKYKNKEEYKKEICKDRLDKYKNDCFERHSGYDKYFKNYEIFEIVFDDRMDKKCLLHVYINEKGIVLHFANIC